MKYMGSKDRLAKHILPIMLQVAQYKGHTKWVEPFVGGANMIDKVPESLQRHGYDSNPYLISMFKMLQQKGIPGKRITKEDYIFYRENKDIDKGMTGYVGFNLSYSGKWFGGFADIVSTRDGVRDYQAEAVKNLSKQLPHIKSVVFDCSDVFNLTFEDSLIYCDPPYAGTTEYKDGSFDSKKFFDWCRNQAAKGNTVFVSEYDAPNDFREVWKGEVKSSLSANGKSGGSKKSVEKLFTL